MMWRESKLYFLLSLFLHAFILVALVTTFTRYTPPPVITSSKINEEIINAVAMDMTVVMPENNLSSRPATVTTPSLPIPVPPAPILPSPPTTKPEPVKQDTVPPKALPIKQVPVKSVLPQKNLLEQQLLADLKAQVAKHQQKIKAEKEQALQESLTKELKEAITKTTEKTMKDVQRASIRSKQMQGEVNKFKALILQSISQHWLVPAGVNKKLASELLIRLAPGGEVIDVQIAKSSGEPSLDRSARDAVFKASPLPVPENSAAFEPFRQFILKVRPENLLSPQASYL